jgi:hypothetical protein
MSVEIVRDVLLWCAVINYLLLIGWSVLFTQGHNWLHSVSVRWFRLSVEQFDAINFAGIVLYKIGIFLFYLTPYIALHIVR